MEARPITHITLDELPPISQQFKLTCQKCGKPGSYDVGRILWDQDGEPPKFIYAFSNYFRCTNCGSAGPWEIRNHLKLTRLMFQAQLSNKFSGIAAGRCALFDGTFIQTPAMGEDHLLDLLLKEPASAFLHTRLGNLFRGSGQRSRAVEWYEKALKLDPGDVEARYHLLDFAIEEEDVPTAVTHSKLLVKHFLAGRTTNKPELTTGMAHYIVDHLLSAPETFREHFRGPPSTGPDTKEEIFIRSLLSMEGNEEEIANDAAHRLLAGNAEPPDTFGETKSQEDSEPKDPSPADSLDKLAKAKRWDAERLTVGLQTDEHGHLRVQDRHTVPLTNGEEVVEWAVPSLRELFRGDAVPPQDIDHYPREYMPQFWFIETHFLALCEAQGDRTDQEMEEIYSMLRRRPDGRSLGASHDFMWQVAALLLGLYVLSEAEFQAIFAALERSTRRWGLRPVSRNYASYVRTSLEEEEA